MGGKKRMDRTERIPSGSTVITAISSVILILEMDRCSIGIGEPSGKKFHGESEGDMNG